MSNKEEYCFRIMRKYGLLVDFAGDPAKANVPDSLEDNDETMAHWFKRVLGSDVQDVVVYCPIVVDGKRKLARVQETVGFEHLRKVVRAQAKVKDAQAEVKKEKAIEKVEKQLSTFSKDTIEDHLAELGDGLEESVKEFFERQINNSPADVDAGRLLKELIKHYNDVACALRRSKLRDQ